jgi:hypothetical protein
MPNIDPAIDFLFSEEFLSAANPYFLQAEIAAAVLLGIGIVYEADEYPHSVHKVAFWCVVVGVVLETIFSILLFASEERVSSLQKESIIELSRRLAARSLSDAQADNIEAALKPFSGQPFQIIPYWQNKESLGIANRIADSLIAAGWQIDQPKDFTSIIGVVTGIYVSNDEGASDEVKNAVRALVEVLRANMIEASEDAENKTPAPTNKININVGIKP